MTADRLPPREPGGRKRILFISVQKLGLKSNSDEMIRATAERDDVDAVHIKLRDPGWLRVLSAQVPGPMNGWCGASLPIVRQRWLWKSVIGHWLDTALPLDRFDAVHMISRTQSAAVVERLERMPAHRRPVFAVAVDATAHCDAREFGSRGPGWDLSERVCRRWDKRMYGLTDLVLCRSRWCADSVVNDYGVARDSTMVVYPSPSRPERPRTPFNGDASRPVRIGFVGNTFKRKGGDRLVKWFAERWQDRAELHIVSRDAVVPAGCRNVHARAHVPREELINSFYPSIDLFVLPTRLDQITWAICEAANAGVAAIGPRMAGIPEAIIDGRTGFVVDRHDDRAYIAAVERLLADRALIDRMGQAAGEHASRTLSREANYPPVIDRLVRLVDERQGVFAATPARTRSDTQVRTPELVPAA